MSNYSKNYTSIENPENQAYVTWEQGMKNIKIFKSGQELYRCDSLKSISDTIKFDHPDNGAVVISGNLNDFSIQISINNEEYTPDEIEIKSTEVKPIAGLFIAFAVLTILASIIQYFSYERVGLIELAYIEIGINLVFTAAYITSAILIYANKFFGYFIGLGFYVIGTLLAAFVLINSLNGFIVFIFLIRLALLVYTFTYFKPVIKLMKHSPDRENENILDL